MHRFPSNAIGSLACAALLANAACSVPPPYHEPDDDPQGTPAPPPQSGPAAPIEVRLPDPTREGNERGLCTKWNGVAVDLSSLGPTTGNDDAQPFFFHGIHGGFSVATTPWDEGTYFTRPRTAALAIDTHGVPVGAGEVDLPKEQADVIDVIATPSGGFLATWGTGDLYEAGTTYFVTYDGNGIPLARSAIIAGSNEGVSLAVDENGYDVAYMLGYGGLSERFPWGIGTLDVSGTNLTFGGGFGDPNWESPIAWRHGALLSTDGGGHLRLFDTHATTLLDLTVPSDAATSSAQYAPGEDGQSVIVVQSSSVSFVNGKQATIVPTDVVLDSAAAWPSPGTATASHATVGFVDSTMTADGSVTFHVVDVSSSGLRGAIGDLTTLPGAFLDDGGVVTMRASYEEDAYMILTVGRTTMSGAIFTCEERAQ